MVMDSLSVHARGAPEVVGVAKVTPLLATPAKQIRTSPASTVSVPLVCDAELEQLDSRSSTNVGTGLQLPRVGAD